MSSKPGADAASPRKDPKNRFRNLRRRARRYVGYQGRAADFRQTPPHPSETSGAYGHRLHKPGVGPISNFGHTYTLRNRSVWVNGWPRDSDRPFPPLQNLRVCTRRGTVGLGERLAQRFRPPLEGRRCLAANARANHSRHLHAPGREFSQGGAWGPLVSKNPGP